MVNVGPLAAEIGLPVWGTAANFNGFRVLAALLHGTLVVSQPNFAALNRGRHLYLPGRPSRSALAHILVLFTFFLGSRRVRTWRTDFDDLYVTWLVPRKEVPFGVAITPHLGGHIPKTPILGRDRRFQSWVAKCKTCILSKLLYRFQPNFAQWQRPPITFVGGPKTRIRNPRWRRQPSWKSKNRHISITVLPIATKFGTVKHVDLLDRVDRQSYEILKIQDGCGRHSEKKRNKASFYTSLSLYTFYLT